MPAYSSMILLLRVVLLGFAASAIGVWCVRKISIRAGLYDPPGPLKIHTGPIPRIGGVGIFLGFLVAAASSHSTFSSNDLLLLAAMVLIWAAGLADDLRELSPALRFVLQCMAGLMVYGSGLGLASRGSSLAGAAVSCLVVVAYINAFNFLDGSDGLAGGIAAVIGLGFSALGHNDPALVIAGLALAAAALGFLVFNFPPARIFMGDSGSTILGFVIALLVLRYAGAGTTFSAQRLGSALVLLALPTGDFIFAILRRLWRRQSPWIGDRSHFFDLLLQRGWSPKRVALCSYAITVALGAVAVAR